MSTLPKILGVKEVCKSRLFKIEALDLEFSNGVKATYERFCNNVSAVMVIPFDGKNFIFESEYCVGTHSYELGFTKGKIDDGEEPKEAALRELSEEIGLGAKKLTYLRTISMAPGFMQLTMYIILAQDLYEHRLDSGDEPEPIETKVYSLEKAKDLLYSQNSPIRESRVLVGLMDALRVIEQKS